MDFIVICQFFTEVLNVLVIFYDMVGAGTVHILVQRSELLIYLVKVFLVFDR